MILGNRDFSGVLMILLLKFLSLGDTEILKDEMVKLNLVLLEEKLSLFPLGTVFRGSAKKIDKRQVNRKKVYSHPLADTEDRHSVIRGRGFCNRR